MQADDESAKAPQGVGINQGPPLAETGQGRASGELRESVTNGQKISHRKSVAKSAGIISGAVMVSRILGLAREMIFAYFFGASKSFAYDAYIIAFRIPNMLRALFAEGALSAAFVTVFSDFLATKGKDRSLRLSNVTTTVLVAILGIGVLVGVIWAPFIVKVLAPGFARDPAKFVLTVKLARIMMPYILLVALAAKAMGVLNACDRFAIPALSSSFFNIGSLGGGLLLAAWMSSADFSHPLRGIIDHPVAGIVGMACGVLIGGTLQYCIQWPSLRREGFRYTPAWKLNDPGLRRLAGLFIPAVIGAAAVQVNVVVNSNFASTLPGNGPVSWLSYAFRLMQFPMGLFGVSIATATLPSISRSAAVFDTKEFGETVASSLRLALLTTIPSAVGLAVLSRPIIALIYQRGDFGRLDTDHTASALEFYAIGLAGYAGTKLMAPAFYALNDGRTPMLVSLASIAANLVLNWALVGPLQERGLALSTSVVALMNFGALYWLMYRRIGDIGSRATLVAAGKIGVASLVMAVVSWISSRVVPGLAASTSLPAPAVRLANVICSVAIGVATFYLVAYLLDVRELKTASSGILRAIRKIMRPGPTGPGDIHD
ncbi:MAG TPA: murein biosynthesis integral membrane protein MurJ [Blastocatellia bacterium]